MEGVGRALEGGVCLGGGGWGGNRFGPRVGRLRRIIFEAGHFLVPGIYSVVCAVRWAGSG